MSQDALKSVYCSYFHSLISYGKIFWGIPQIICMSFDFNRGQLESLLGQDQRLPVQNCLRNGGYHHYSLSILSRFHYSLWTTRMFSMLIQIYTVLILGKVLTFISHRLTYHCIRKGLTILALKFLIVSSPT
jgi:hypothetical protein